MKVKLGDGARARRFKVVVRNVDALKREVHRLGRELLQERTKVKALSEELENPLNVHRWRALEGSSPATFEMIQKIQTLQRRLVAKTEETAEKDALIAEKERLYGELKKILARQPGPELAEQLSVYQQNLREKNRQLKSVASSSTCTAASRMTQMEIERLTRELNELKRKYYETKRREQLSGVANTPTRISSSRRTRCRRRDSRGEGSASREDGCVDESFVRSRRMVK